MLWIFLLIFGLMLIFADRSGDYDEIPDEYDHFPKAIRKFGVRRDSYTKNPVSRGQFASLATITDGGLMNVHRKVTLGEFKRILQCSINEPSLDGNRGSYSLLKMLPPTKQITKLICAWSESQCERWRSCYDWVERFESGLYEKNSPLRPLMRIIRGKLYKDWPWGVERLKDPYPSMKIIITQLLNMVSDLGDSMFFLGTEQTFLPYNIPFPSFTNSPSFKSSDIPWPWYESLVLELKLYSQALKTNKFNHNFTDELYRLPFSQLLSWDQRIAKVGYYGEMMEIRQIFFDSAMIRPDLFDVHWKCDFCGTDPWNPTSKEHRHQVFWIDRDQNQEKHQEEIKNIIPNIVFNQSKVGYIQPLSKLRSFGHVNYNPGKYKYLAVLTGIEGKATSGRLASLLAHSGAVILLQQSEFNYHFSARLLPWVHYVPISYTTADIIDKIEWLKKHDDMAQIIAQNGMNFGKSYLRLEDQFCYVATILDKLAILLNNTDALEPFKPVSVN